jgi:hypothetical protein
LCHFGRELAVDVTGQGVDAAVAFHQVAEGDGQAEVFFDLQRSLGEGERIEPQFDEGGGRVGIGQLDARAVFKQGVEAGDERRQARGGLGHGGGRRNGKGRGSAD